MDLLQTVCRRAVLSGARPTLLPNAVRTFSGTPITNRGSPSAIERLRQSLVKRSPGQSSNSALPPRPPAPSILDVVDEIRADSESTFKPFDKDEFLSKYATKKKEPALRLVPQTGRTINVSRGDPAHALRVLDGLVKRNAVRRELALQRFHERPALKRKRQKRERWRKRFGEGVRAAIARTLSLKQQGW
ncbi:hypothetical protein QBC47DRAFT_390335 [Echria macrotheca]|uniref:Ribosomal protein S21 n=1 Tax=Echria macrotheca TaxID=438768 RepID=A0AAJ0B6C4_9PEZI|nr:hypothetical protein QBC47DRAFT_390335 [Echria macrotheca]